MNAIRFMVAFALLMLGVGTAQAQGLQIEYPNVAPPGNIVKTGLTKATGVVNGTGLVLWTTTTTACVGAQGEVPNRWLPDGGINENLSAVIFDNGAGLISFSYAVPNFPLWQISTNQPLVQVTLQDEQGSTWCVPSTPPTVATTKFVIDATIFLQNVLRVGSFNYAVGKINVTGVVTQVDQGTGQPKPLNCTVPPDTNLQRAPLTGAGPAVLVGLRNQDVAVVMWLAEGAWNVHIKPNGPFTCNGVGTDDRVFQGTFSS